ncbi:hypothetical protein CY35_11G051500 [Sphagnum magellanicum]|nr:hypothetical protein CY35_11G051500 [Sphagnum magellanicum]
MGRAPCCEKDNVKRGPWTPEEDAKLLACIAQHGTGSWRTLPKKAGLQRCGKSCRLRWTNYLRPDLKHGRFTDHEENLIVNLHAALGSRWSLIAAQLPGRTDNDVKNYWNTRLKKKLCEMGIDPITHKPISQLLADLAGSIALPKGGEIAEAALGCFKDDMLNVLMRKRPDWQQQLPLQDQLQAGSSCIPMHQISTPAATAHHIVGGNPHHQAAAAAAAARAASLTSTPKNSILAGRPSANSSCDMRTAIVSNHDQCHDQTLKSNDHLQLKVGLKDGQQTMEEAALAAGSQNQQLELMQQQQRSRFCSHSGLVDQGSVSCTASGSYQLLQAPQLLSNHQAVTQENQSCSTSHNNNNNNNQTHDHVLTNYEMEPWSPSMASGSSCSSTSLMAAGGAGGAGDSTGLQKVLNSDVFLWDFSELSSIMN